MDVIVKKSSDLNANEFEKISMLFETVFEKHRDIKTIKRQYEQNPFGYAWLSMLADGDEIVGINSYVPSFYMINGEKKIFANSIDSMVKKEYRDFFNFSDMIKKAYKEMAANGVDFVYGYPNDNSYPVLTKGKLMKTIGKMNTYCLPYRIGGIKPSLKFLNFLSMGFSHVFSYFSYLTSSPNPHRFIIKKDIESYNSTRYKRGDSDYEHYDLGDGMLHYKVTNHEGIRTAFIIDIDKKSPKNFNKAVRFLLKHHSADFDIILYPGCLPFSNCGLIRLPRKAEPKNFNFTGKILKKDSVGDCVWDIRNWDTNLSNYDLI